MIIPHDHALHKRTPLATWGLLDPNLPAAERVRRLRQLRGSLRTLYGVQANPAADAIHQALREPTNPVRIEEALRAIKIAGRPARRPATWEARP
jgi:hypothetical protein